jgi:replication factor A1
MGDENYNRIVDKIALVSGNSKDDVLRKIEAKRAKLSGLISQEGAAQIVAAELGVSFDNEKLKVNELLPGMRKINVVGKIVRLFPVRTFKTQKGDDGKVLNLFLADDTSNVKVVLWDVNHIALFENEQISEGHVVEISNASVRDGEIHLGSFSDLKVSEEKFENVVTEKKVSEKNILDLKISDNAKVRAFVVQSFNPKFFEVSKETGRKPTEEERNNGVPLEKKALINFVLDDGTETIRTVVFHDNLGKLGLTELEDEEKSKAQVQNLLGKELIVSGVVRRNNYFNNEEFIANEIQEVDFDELIGQFENK